MLNEDQVTAEQIQSNKRGDYVETRIARIVRIVSNILVAIRTILWKPKNKNKKKGQWQFRSQDLKARLDYDFPQCFLHESLVFEKYL